MPMKRTSKAVILFGAAVGLAASFCAAWAETPASASKPLILAQGRFDRGGPGLEEEKRKDVERRKLQQRKEQRHRAPPPRVKEQRHRAPPPRVEDRRHRAPPPRAEDRRHRAPPPRAEDRRHRAPPPRAEDRRHRAPPPRAEDRRHRAPPPRAEDRRHRAPPPRAEDRRHRAPPPRVEDRRHRAPPPRAEDRRHRAPPPRAEDRRHRASPPRFGRRDRPDFGRKTRKDDATGSLPVWRKPPRKELGLRRKLRRKFTRERLKDITKHRRKVRDKRGRVIIHESGNRRIIREKGRAFIHHDDTDRLRLKGRKFHEERGPKGHRRRVVVRPDGVTIITVVDDDGRLLRRIRRDRRGREFTLIDNRRRHWRRHRGHRIGDFGFVVNLPAPVIRIPHDEYYVDADYASEDEIYLALNAPPVDDIEPDYTLDEIRYSSSLRDRFRRVSLSTINFEFGSWELSDDQIDRLEVIARAIRRILRRSSDEVFLISGFTDAVGSDEDNLSLSDRRAETVARVLSDEFDIPPENLVTQGYGEQYLLVDTQGPERRNRRVEFQRITEALARNNQETGDNEDERDNEY